MSQAPMFVRYIRRHAEFQNKQTTRRRRKQLARIGRLGAKRFTVSPLMRSIMAKERDAAH